MSDVFGEVPPKILAFCCSGVATINRDGIGMENALKGKSFEANQWRGDPLNGNTLTVWNDVGMGDAFQFVRYTLPLLQRGEKVRFAVANRKFPVSRPSRLALSEVIDRRNFSPGEGGTAHSPDEPDRSFRCQHPLGPTLRATHLENTKWCVNNDTEEQVGFCWASNPQDRTMHAYKSCTPEQLLALQRKAAASMHADQPANR